MTKKMKMFLTAALAVSAMASAAWAQPAGSPVAKHGTLSVQNGKIVNKDGQPVALRGMSFFWNQWSEGSVYYTSGVTGWLASDWKVDVVRVAINPGNSGDNDNWKTVVDAAITNGIYVIIDWHSHTADQQTSSAQSFFQKRATEYKSTPNVLFEIFNEPIEQSWSTIRTYATSVVSSIRDSNKGGANNIIIIGSRDYSKRVDEAAANPVSGTNLAYSIHYYTAEPGTMHQGALRSIATTAINAGLALFVTEWGLSEADGGIDHPNTLDTEEANTWFTFLDRNSIGWANWSICNKNEAASALKNTAGAGGNWTADDLSPSGTFVRQKLIDYATKTFTVSTAKTGNGTITLDPPGPTYKQGTMVTVAAVPDPGWAFERWSGTDGAALGVKNPAAFSGPLYSNKSVTAVFGLGSMIKNGTFTNAISDWTQQSTGVTLAQEDGTLKVTVTGLSAAVRQYDLTLEQGKKYTLSFRAKASTGSVSVVPRMTNRTGTAYWEGAPVALTTGWTPYTMDFNMCSANDATARFWLQTNGASGAVYYVDDIMLDESGAVPLGACQTASVLSGAMWTPKTSWSVTRTGGALQLRGPAEAGARVSLYDVRGKVIRSMAAADGLTLGAGVPAGSYFVVVRDRAGGELLRAKAVLAK